MIRTRSVSPFAAAIAVALNTAAIAQDRSTGVPPPPDAPSDGVGLEVVTVTARKISEDLQRTPAAITALSGEALVAAGVHDIRAAQNLVPSVRFQAENASTEIYIRGVGSTLDLPNIEPPTVFNFEGVYVPREGTSVGFFDVAQVEVLPGPQGTLYGRAALGGTVNVRSNRPTREFETSGLVEVGSHALLHGTLVQNLPVTDTLALRGAVDYVEHDGYLRTGADSKDDAALRLSALYEPGESVDLFVWTHAARKDGKSPNLVRRGYNDGNFDGNPNDFDHADPWDDRISADAPTASPQDYDSLALGAELGWDLGEFRLTWIPAYYELDWAGDYWLEDIPALLTADYEQVTQELRLAGSSERWEWLAGLYAYRVTNSGEFVVGGFPLADITRNRLEGVAAFGQGTRALGNTLRLTVGGRASVDSREGEGQTAFGVPYSAEEDYRHLDWKLGLEKDLGDSLLAYATVQTGYQPGTYNLFPATPGQSNLVEEATLTAWTAGFKSRFLDDRLQLNNELFYYDYRDLLVQSFNLNTALLTTFNAERAETWGNQLDLLFQSSERGRLNVSVGWLHARYEDFIVPDDVNIGIPRRDFGGYELQYAPEWTVTAGYQHDFALAAGYLRARIETRYESSFWGTFAQSRGTEQQSYTKSDASLTWHADDERWSLGLWVRNIEDEAVLAATTTGQFGPYANAFLEAPRTWGARFTFDF